MKPLGDLGMRSRITILMSGSVVLVTVGFITDWWWLIGIGAWMLIAAGLIEMIYRP
ncbi:hypothetical protein ACFC5X_12200 [Streptomyces sp. NPDC055952]|uniref:hypothetical protein n=1 Tax=Streptomyces sp. NPDC055952 TaxID=3345663 RepID=UPI0035D6DCB7